MNLKVNPTEFTLLRDYIEEQCGICLKPEKAYLVENRLSSLMEEYKCRDFSEFYRLVKGGSRLELRDKLVDAMTTNETLWFRDQHPFAILKEKLLPEFVSEIKAGKRQKVRIWSGASSTGQEPYSIAMTLRDFCATQITLRPEMCEIIATDISPTALAAAQAGRYDSVAMGRGMSPEVLNRYFKQDGLHHVVHPDIRKMVQFKRFNLQDSPIGFSPVDVIFLRYVAIYFSEEFKRGLFARLARTLSPGGYLVIGAIETLRGISDDFKTENHAGGAYYKRIK